MIIIYFLLVIKIIQILLLLQYISHCTLFIFKIYNIIKPYIQTEDEEEGGEDQLTNQEYKTRDRVERQKNFIDSKYRKKRVHKNVKNEIQKLANTKTSITDYKINNNSSVTTLVTKSWEDYFCSPVKKHLKDVDEGINMGKRLLKQLKVRNISKQDIFENLKKGKLDVKKIYSAPYNENIFNRVEKEALLYKAFIKTVNKVDVNIGYTSYFY